MEREVVFLEEEYKLLQKHLFKDGKEQAACILCGLSDSENKISFLVTEIFPVQVEHILLNNDGRIEYSCDAYEPVIKKALKSNQCFFIVHSHFNNYQGFSELDDVQEEKLLKCAYSRINTGYHGSLVFNDYTTFEGRVYNPINGAFEVVSKLKIIGDKYSSVHSIKSTERKHIDLEKLDRNIRAFGKEMQYIMADLHVGIIGCGGTGSALIEMLSRMGLGTITLVDHDVFNDNNITRMHNTKGTDVGRAKVDIMEEMINSLGLGTKVIKLMEKLNNKSTAQKLKTCDIIFSCLDDTQFARMILNMLSIYYYIPLIDTGINFDSRKGVLYDVLGRIDIITPERACLKCRGIIDLETCASEMLSPEDYERLIKVGYAKELKDDNVQSITYNTMIAAQAINELIYMLLGLSSKDINSHKVFKYIDGRTTNAGVSDLIKEKDCVCNNKQNLGRGDAEAFLGMYWPEKNNV